MQSDDHTLTWKRSWQDTPHNSVNIVSQHLPGIWGKSHFSTHISQMHVRCYSGQLQHLTDCQEQSNFQTRSVHSQTAINMIIFEEHLIKHLTEQRKLIHIQPARSKWQACNMYYSRIFLSLSDGARENGCHYWDLPHWKHEITWNTCELLTN
jgi:hypothetical protein